MIVETPVLFVFQNTDQLEKRQFMPNTKAIKNVFLAGSILIGRF